MDRVQKILGIQEEDPSEVEKFNPNHDKQTGKFTTGDSKAPKIDVSAFSAQVMNNPPTETKLSFAEQKDLWRALGFTVMDELNTDPALKTFYQNQVKGLKDKYGLKLDFLTFKSLNKDVLAQAKVDWKTDFQGKYDMKLTMFIASDAQDVMMKTWDSDKQLIANKQQPWMSSSYASSKEEFIHGIVAHETGHMVMSRHTLQQPQEAWNDPSDPIEGTKTWKKVVDGAMDAGWSGASQYAMTDYGEMYAECFALTEMNRSTGNKDVDRYVKEVATNA